MVLPGILRSTSAVARMLSETCPGWAITVIELPGIGGSARIDPRSAAHVAAMIEEAITLLHIDVAAALAYDLSAPIAQVIATRHPTARLLLVDTESARQWVARRVSPPSLALRTDGTHLAALWTHIRDSGMLDPVSPTRVSKSGSPLADVADLDAAVVAAAVKPEGYAALWVCCAEAFDQSDAGDSRTSLCTQVETADVPALLAGWLSEVPAASATAEAAAPPDGAVAQAATTVRYSYLQLPSGRVHVRRAGNATDTASRGGRRTLLIFHSAPGSAEPLEALMLSLAHGREVIACDYLGNGDSDKAAVGIDADIATDIDIATLARHGREVADALGLEQVDLFGTHTGAMIAMEFAIHWPDRVGRMILEAPVLIDPAFAADILEHYLPPLVPDRWGTHLLRAWNMRRDMFLFWPWYQQAREAARVLGTPPLDLLHDWTVGLLKSGTTYDRSYRAAFVYDTRARLPLLPRPALICAGPADMLVEGLEEARRLAPAGTRVSATPATVWYPGQSPEAVRETIAFYDAFLRAE
ncbi:hypothetical protein BH11PSE13_BH11PSE13_32420 [soil metagenome]